MDCATIFVQLKPLDGSSLYPEYTMKGEYCLRCASFCPRSAISVPFNYKNKIYSAVKAKYIL